MYEELIEALRLCVKYGKAEDALANASQAADAIEELQADKAALNGTVTNLLGQIKDLGNPRWISVTERLPEKPGNYLTAMGNGRIIENVFMMDDSDAWQNWHPHGKWYYNEDVWAGVTHWQPLPEPPKEETGRASDE